MDQPLAVSPNTEQTPLSMVPPPGQPNMVPPPGQPYMQPPPGQPYMMPPPGQPFMPPPPGQPYMQPPPGQPYMQPPPGQPYMQGQQQNYNQSVAYKQQTDVVVQPVVVANNQVKPDSEVNNEGYIKTLRSCPVVVKCPFCGNTGLTVVENSCSCGNVCCCLLTSCFCWLLYQGCRGKDCNCKDAIHRCAKCGKTIGQYFAC